MTNPKSTHITLIADRTGSMHSVRTDAEGAINQFLSEQRKLEDECSLLLVDFDDQEPFRIVYDGRIQDSTNYRLEPRGNTPLLDAVGLGIVTTGQRLAALAEDDRPGTVLFVIQTDGHENASREYRRDQVNAMITEQTDQWKWTFVFLGAGKDAWAASQMFAGTQLGRNVLRSSGSAKSFAGAASYMSDTVTALRGGEVTVAAVAFAGDLTDDGEVTPDDDTKTVARKRTTPLP